ncbi:hypothetical protein J7T55_007606 [Diaporthe amygdali]|uniref:uncharacterized protein n=1 Tax=Phomopsis amygdali TaxID=1214568 RepID=UPI0022FEBCC2|nr:uncharacterized protein J7T55_007606 [Diaporthe amygdali]KAJ0107236.1 hypothetical protein J7T55_007606 [Diaporthe amygdali]
MDASPQHSQTILLENLPSELLRRIVDFCAESAANGRITLHNLSVLNKFLGNVTAARLFDRVCFQDAPSSRGDEILQSIREFNAVPGLWCHVRAVVPRLNRHRRLTADINKLAEPYHYLVLVRFFETLGKMPYVKDLHMYLDGEPGLDNWEVCSGSFGLSISNLDWLQAFPKLEVFSLDGYRGGTDLLRDSFERGELRPPSASTLRQLRIVRTSSDARLGFCSLAWKKSEALRLSWLIDHLPHLEHLSVIGELGGGFPVSVVLNNLHSSTLKYIDVTDEQVPEERRRSHAYVVQASSWPEALPVAQPSRRLSYIADQAHQHQLNENRAELARQTFRRMSQLRRICFVRSSVGEVFLRNYYDTVADSTGSIYDRVKYADLGDIPKAWHHGVPQTTLLPYPGYTAWEGIDEGNMSLVSPQLTTETGFGIGHEDGRLNEALLVSSARMCGKDGDNLV